MKNGLKRLIGAGMLATAGIASSGCVVVIKQQYEKPRTEDCRLREENSVKRPNLEDHFFACNSYRDYDCDGKMDFPEEFAGIKNRFRECEDIVLVSYTPNSLKGERQNLYLFSPKGKLVLEEDWKINKDGYAMRIKLDNPDMIAKVHGCGNYRALWTVDGKVAGKTDFVLTK